VDLVTLGHRDHAETGIGVRTGAPASSSVSRTAPGRGSTFSMNRPARGFVAGARRGSRADTPSSPQCFVFWLVFVLFFFFFFFFWFFFGGLFLVFFCVFFLLREMPARDRARTATGTRPGGFMENGEPGPGRGTRKTLEEAGARVERKCVSA